MGLSVEPLYRGSFEWCDFVGVWELFGGVSYRIFWDRMIAHVNICAKHGPSPCLRNRAL